MDGNQEMTEADLERLQSQFILYQITEVIELAEEFAREENDARRKSSAIRISEVARRLRRIVREFSCSGVTPLTDSAEIGGKNVE